MTRFWVHRIPHIFEAGGGCDWRNITTFIWKTKSYFIRSWLISHCCILISSSIWLQLCLMSYYKCINQISFISRSAEKNVDANTSSMLNVTLGSAAEGGEVNQSPLWCLFSIINKKHQQAKENTAKTQWLSWMCMPIRDCLEMVFKKEKCNCCRLVTLHSPFLLKSVFIRRNSPWSLFPNKPNSINCCVRCNSLLIC